MKITKHRHGLQIGWGSIFWHYDGKQADQGTYRAYVEAEGPRFKQISSANCHIMSPAQQMLWKVSPEDEFKHILNPYAAHWLKNNVGERGPDWYARTEPFDLMFLSILFRRRTDALKFIQYVSETLEQRAHDDD
jgi:hypothetical protein